MASRRRRHYSDTLMKNTAQTINLQTTIPNEAKGKRLDLVLAELFSDYSRAKLQQWIRAKQLLVDGQVKRPRDVVRGGEIITLNTTLDYQEYWEAQAIQLNIVYEDEALLVINKPIGLVVHPAAGNPDKTLVNALLYHAPELAHLPRAGIVHRLDKDTSGLLVVAKTLVAHTHLIKQLQTHSVKREYAAITNGVLISGGTIDAPISRHSTNRKKMAVVENGKFAITHYRVIERFRAHSFIKVRLETGRTHQIRVHMAHIAHPLVGDSTYGGRLQLPKNSSDELITILRNFKHQALHAKRLGLIHPITHEYQEWQTALPKDMQALLAALRKDADENRN